MNDWNLPCPSVSEPFQNGQISNLSTLLRCSSRIPDTLCMCLPQILRGAHVNTQQSSYCDHLVPEFHLRSQLDNFRGDSDVEDRLENLLDPPGHSRAMGQKTARLGPGVAAS
jgi:hypothetical protein